MKRITYIIAILFACTSCSDTFLDNAPKGKYHEGNYDMGTAQELLVLATVMDGYNVFAQQTWPITAMQCHTTDNSHPGGPSGDGGVDFSQFPTMSFTPANSMFNTYYSLQFTAITKANEALPSVAEGVSTSFTSCHSPSAGQATGAKAKTSPDAESILATTVPR